MPALGGIKRRHGAAGGERRVASASRVGGAARKGNVGSGRARRSADTGLRGRLARGGRARGRRAAQPDGGRELRRQRLSRIGKALALMVALLLAVVPVVLLADPISYVPPIMALLVGLCSYVMLVLGARGVGVDEGALATSCERGSAIPLRITLSNRSWVPVARAEVVFFISDIAGGYDAMTSIDVALAPREDLDLVFNATFAHLGRYTAGVDRVVLHDLLGLSQRTIQATYHDPIDVRPRIFDLENLDLSSVAKEESLNVFKPVVADDLDYSGVREYRPGDPLKTVHWNLSGRNPEGKLYTRLFEVYAEPGLVVILDPYAPDYEMEDLMGAFDGLVESAASISAVAREMGVDAEVRYLDRDGAPASIHLGSAKDVDSLVHTMMPAAPASRSNDSDAALELLLREARAPQGRGNVAFCTSRASSQAVEALTSIRNRRRNPLMFMAVPRSLAGRERSDALALLPQLSAAKVPYFVVETTEVQTEVKAS